MNKGPSSKNEIREPTNTQNKDTYIKLEKSL